MIAKTGASKAVLGPSKRGEVDPFIVMEVVREAMALEQTGAAVHHLEVGQPAVGAPKTARDAAIQLLSSGAPMGYTQALGLPVFRAAVSAHYKAQYGLIVPEHRIVATSGSSGGFVLSFLAAFEAGDRVALASPGYPAYRNTLQALGLQVVTLLGQPEDSYQPTPELLAAEIERSGPIQGLIVASPANPTGAILARDEQQALVDFCTERGIRLLADEIYHGLSYDKPTASFVELSNDVIILNSFSKYFCMTGWRIGWLVLPEQLVQNVERLGQNLFICPPAVAQLAAVAAFEGRAELDGHFEVYRRNRLCLVDAIEASGLGPYVEPDGAFYLYVDISAHCSGAAGDDSVAWCQRLLAETGIAATPGVDFDQERGTRTIRLSYCTDELSVAEAAQKLITWMKA